MMSREQLEWFRSLSNDERFKLTTRNCRFNWKAMFEGDPDKVDRRFWWVCKYSDERNRNLRQRIASVSSKKVSDHG